MVTHNHNTNAYNVFKSLKATNLHEDFLYLSPLWKEYQEEYEALSKEEKDELIEEFNAYKQDTMKICCLTAHTCIQDVANVAHNVQLLMTGVTYCVGIEGFFCIV
ncbi:hypothetical protein L208DRAFT_1524022 [Tricholoma matsutake]|nr:hypothetical protein L208DRAFT_1524022 [Tricholoma matsutake 945]